MVLVSALALTTLVRRHHLSRFSEERKEGEELVVVVVVGWPNFVVVDHL